jgi:hypothetical protein
VPPPSMLPGVAAWLAEAGEGEEEGEGELASEAQEEELRRLLLEMQHPHPHPSQQQQEEEGDGSDEQEWFGAHPSTSSSSSGSWGATSSSTGTSPSLLDRPEGTGTLFLPGLGAGYPGQDFLSPAGAAGGAGAAAAAGGGRAGGGVPLVASSHPEVLEMVANKAHQLRDQIQRWVVLFLVFAGGAQLGGWGVQVEDVWVRGGLWVGGWVRGGGQERV